MEIQRQLATATHTTHTTMAQDINKYKHKKTYIHIRSTRISTPAYISFTLNFWLLYWKVRLC